MTFIGLHELGDDQDAYRRDVLENGLAAALIRWPDLWRPR